MDDFAELALEGIPIVTEHYDKVYDPLKEKTQQGIHKVKKMREKRRGGGYESETDSEYEEVDRYGPPSRSQTDPRARQYRDDDRRRSRGGEVLDERYTYSKASGRAKSIGHGRDSYRKGSRRNYSDSESSLSPPRRERRKSLGEKALAALGLTGATGLAIDKERKERSRRRSRSRSRPRRDRTPSSDSEGYYVRKKDRSRGIPPPPSSSAAGYRDDRTPARYKPSAYIENGDRGSDGGNNSQVARRNNRSEVSSQRNGSRNGKKDKKGGDNGSSSESSSDVCSSSEDERRTKKMKGKEYITGALAAVATIHAAHSVYSSMEARDKRHKEVEEGKMTAEDARKKKNKARLQDAAAIGIAALGIKGAYSEWQEVQENRQELAEAQEERKKNHEKRMRKLEKYGCLKPGDREKEKAYSKQRTRSEGGGRRRERSYSR
ncbi:hypothetical protein JMJ35_009990 [Cladonia borealis]|uniref:Uncharacterized protein n=1 Tax=Cladonia borealis TaxID=184061 RepID=A0AA39QQT3_9LECA|nr:hypothetical protein JMJ35_009990 [Cladonia borealis]